MQEAHLDHISFVSSSKHNQVSFIETGSNVWITLYSKVGRKGNAYLINPGSNIHLKDIRYANGDGSWKDRMQSLYFVSQKLSNLGTDIDRNINESNFPKIETGDDDGTHIDLEYKVGLI